MTTPQEFLLRAAQVNENLEIIKLQNQLIVCQLGTIKERLMRIEARTTMSNINEAEMSAATDRLKEKVTRIEDRGDATIALLKGLAQQIRDGAGDEAAMNKMADDLEAQAGEFDAAIIENTPTPPST